MMDDCGSIPQKGYAEFSEWLHQRVGNQRIPLAGSLEVTMRCNLRCQHCYIPGEMRAGPPDRELILAEIRRILDEVTGAGCLWLLLTGGDPFVRADFLDIYAYARSKGLILTIFTNGTLITPRIADYLAEWRPFGIEITLYGATEETYERVTGIPGSFRRCMRGIELLLERNLPLSLKTMVMTLNHHELEQMKSLAVALGVRFRYDPIVHFANDGSARPGALRLTPEEIVAIEITDPDRSRLWPEQFRIKPVIPAADRGMYLCGAGKQGFHIDAAGRLCLCMTARNPSFDLRSGSFQEGWDQFLPKMAASQYPSDFPCLHCKLRTLCPQCPAMGELEHGDVHKHVDFLCQITKLRSEAFAAEK